MRGVPLCLREVQTRLDLTNLIEPSMTKTKKMYMRSRNLRQPYILRSWVYLGWWICLENGAVWQPLKSLGQGARRRGGGLALAGTLVTRGGRTARRVRFRIRTSTVRHTNRRTKRQTYTRTHEHGRRQAPRYPYDYAFITKHN